MDPLDRKRYPHLPCLMEFRQEIYALACRQAITGRVLSRRISLRIYATSIAVGGVRLGPAPPTKRSTIHCGHPLRDILWRWVFHVGGNRPGISEWVEYGGHPVAPKLIGRCSLRGRTGTDRAFVRGIDINSHTDKTSSKTVCPALPRSTSDVSYQCLLPHASRRRPDRACA